MTTAASFPFPSSEMADLRSILSRWQAQAKHLSNEHAPSMWAIVQTVSAEAQYRLTIAPKLSGIVWEAIEVMNAEVRDLIEKSMEFPRRMLHQSDVLYAELREDANLWLKYDDREGDYLANVRTGAVDGAGDPIRRRVEWEAWLLWVRKFQTPEGEKIIAAIDVICTEPRNSD